MRMKIRVFFTLLTAALALAVAPVAAPQSDAAKATTITVTAKEFSFTLSKKTAPQGTVTFKVTNKGKLDHDFKIGTKKTALLKPGKSAMLRVTLKKGTIAYLCTVPGHAAAGMKGKFKVT